MQKDNTIVCIVCPQGCRITQGADGTFNGNACPRGEAFAHKELTNPTRTLTTTVRVEGTDINGLPVKTDGEIPRALLLPAMHALRGVLVHAPVQVGDVVLQNLLDTGVNVVATRNVARY